MGKLRITIEGPPGSGKSRIAQKIRAMMFKTDYLPEQIVVVDNFKIGRKAKQFVDVMIIVNQKEL